MKDQIPRRVKRWLVEDKWQRRHILFAVAIAAVFAFAMASSQSMLAQSGGGIYLPLIQNGEADSQTTADPFYVATSADLDDVAVGLSQNGEEQVLVLGGQSGMSGMPLYTYLEDNEETGKSACDGECAKAWPPFIIDSAESVPVMAALDAALGTVRRADGALQVTHNGWPLYRYSGDQALTHSAVVAASSLAASGHGIDGLWWQAEAEQTVADEIDLSLTANTVFESAASVVSSFAEAGSVRVNQPSRSVWHTVNLNQSYTQPAVIMQPLSFDGAQPATIRVKAVTSRSFQFKIDEWSYQDGAHTAETIHYIVVEAGIHTLPYSGGRKIHAGIVDVNHNWSDVAFDESFSKKPVVLSQVQSLNGGDVIVTRQRRVTSNKFQIRLQEEESEDDFHAVEQVAYLAIEPGRASLGGMAVEVGHTPNSVTPKWHSIDFAGEYEEPIFLAAMQTTDGTDVANLRYRLLTKTGVSVAVQEEQSKDDELTHTTEMVGYMVLGNGDAPTPEPTAVTPTVTPTPITPTPTPSAGGQVVYIVAADTVRLERENNADSAQVEIRRAGGSNAINVEFATLGNTNPTKGSASPSDYIIRDADGQVLSNSIPFKIGQTIQTITIEAVADDQIEVPETLRIQLQNGAGYSVRESDNLVTIRLRDDRSGVTKESRFFYGQMVPENGAATNATGWAVIRLSNDNAFGMVNVSFSDLTGAETASHIHYANPDSGPIVHSIPLGQVVDDQWKIRAMHDATTDQAMLDALLAGRLYINVHSKNYLDGEIRGTMRLTEGSPEFTPPPPADPIETLAGDELRRDILRFLTQASFGPTIESVADMEARMARHGGDRIRAYEEWIDEQMTLEAPSMLEFLHANMKSYTNGVKNTDPMPNQARTGRTHYTPAWYTSAVYSHAQLRERMAFALSEIFVISNADNQIRRSPWLPASYDDMLSRNAFGPFETLLTDVSQHPAMGMYLSHFKNKQTVVRDGQVVSRPDENYAREVMQLFSIGLVLRHPDGSLLVGENGLPIRTYEQDDISELARVFTGWGFAVQQLNYGKTDGSVENTSFSYKPYKIENGAYYWPHLTVPMKNFPFYHDDGEKTWLDGDYAANWPDSSLPAGRSGEQELQTVMHVLSNHPNTSVFISRQLIQRLVTSNPSGGYLYRVSQRFEETGGDLGEVVKAILLDPEARNLSALDGQGNGKIKEPLLQLVALMRFSKPSMDTASAFNFSRLRSYDYPRSQVNLFEDDAQILYLGDCIGSCDDSYLQTPLYSPTVFNYFLPDYSPSGPVIDAGLVAPELQLLDEDNAVGVYNAVRTLTLTDSGVFGTPPTASIGAGDVRYRYNQPQWMADAYMTVMDTNGNDRIDTADASITNADTIRAATTALVDMADDYLCAGRLQANATGDPDADAREIIITGVTDALAYRDRKRTAAEAKLALEDRIREALYLVTSAPQCMFME